MGLFTKKLFAGLSLLTAAFQIHAQGFNLSTLPVVGANPIQVVAADVNGDGKPDLISLSGSVDLLTVLTNNGSGGFGSNVTLQTGLTGFLANSFTASDINGDGRVDLICSLSTGNPNYISRLFVLTNNGNGSFGPGNYPDSYYLTGTNPACVIAADVNGDGKPDLISANIGGLFPFFYHTISILTNNGSGIFGSNATLNVGTGPRSLVAADVNGDGKLDLITANFNDNTLTILTNGGTLGFKPASSPPTGGSPLGIVAADVNGDGKMDLISANSGDSTLSVLTNDGTGNFVLASTPKTGMTPYSIIAADINGDGKVDLICPNLATNTLTILTNDGHGNFVVAFLPPVGTAPFYVTAGDLNGDGRLDLACANTGTNTISVLTNALTFLPTLTVQHLGNKVLVTWPSQWTGWAGWILQENGLLGPNGWTSFGGVISDDGTTKTVTNSPVTGNIFFRLEHP